MKYESIFTVEISVRNELVVKQQIKAHNVADVINKLANKYADGNESQFSKE